MENNFGLAIITLDTLAVNVALRIGSVLEASQSDRWMTVAQTSNNITKLIQCSFQGGNLTCPIGASDNFEKKVSGWPVIVKRASWKASKVVGLWQPKLGRK